MGCSIRCRRRWWIHRVALCSWENSRIKQCPPDNVSTHCRIQHKYQGKCNYFIIINLFRLAKDLLRRILRFKSQSKLNSTINKEMRLKKQYRYYMTPLFAVSFCWPQLAPTAEALSHCFFFWLCLWYLSSPISFLFSQVRSYFN